MDSSKQLLLKRSVSIRAIVTSRWKDDAQQQLQLQINQLDNQLQALETQAQQMISDIQIRNYKTLDLQSSQQIENIQTQVSQRKSEILEQKSQILQEVQRVHQLELGQEVEQGQIESMFEIGVGENLIEKLQVNILLHDGIVQEIRSNLPGN